jgi:octaheme c-type cytochrome (tetrathionate reductase family)
MTQSTKLQGSWRRFLGVAACLIALICYTGCSTPPPDDNGNDNSADNVNDNEPADNVNDNEPTDNVNDNEPADNVNDNDEPVDNANDNDMPDDNDNDNDPGDDLPPFDGNIHVLVFEDILEKEYEGTSDCLTCHSDVADDVLMTGHWNWEGESTNLLGRETEVHGKTDLINNFCIAVPSNEGRCTQCHIGYGWSSNEFDFSNPANIDCLVCHDTTGTYAKAPTTAGQPDQSIDLHQVALNVGDPSREACGSCHFFAGGGDNVKHGDLAASLVDTTREYDVHMATNGLDFNCQVCHQSQNHGIAGMPLHSTNEGSTACTDCHSESGLHEDEPVVNIHLSAVACQACHIPTFARHTPTKVFWDWSTAGQDIDPIPTDEFGKPLYDKKKGSFIWDMNVKPELRWFNGKWDRVVLADEQHYDTLPAVLAEPVGDISDPTAKLYPFKRMEGIGAIDPVNQIVLVPHLFGMVSGDNPYWVEYNWDLALAEGAAYAGQNYSGEYDFGETIMYLSVNHEIAPKEQALGCLDCHLGALDFQALGYESDPWDGTGRP